MVQIPLASGPFAPERGTAPPGAGRALRNAKLLEGSVTPALTDSIHFKRLLGGYQELLSDIRGY